MRTGLRDPEQPRRPVARCARQRYASIVSSRRKPWDIVHLGAIFDDEVTSVLASQYRVPSVDLDAYVVEDTVLKVVSRELCERHSLIPVSRTGGSLIVAMTDPTNRDAIDTLTRATGYAIEPVVATKRAIDRAIAKYLRPRPSLN
jgi:type IV pilus assembly protein PilB